MLEQDGIALHPVPDIKGAVLVTAEARRVTQSRAYRDGLVEVQDTSSQAAMAALEVPPGARGLDYCAGGGGKVLALASRIEGAWFAHDAAPRRMRDLPQRAARAGVTVTLLDAGAVSGTAPFDLVLCDVPCSGSGTWRRTPEAKWTLTPERLADLCRTQRSILQEAQALVRPGGMLAYTTCSVLDEENAGQVAAFLAASSGWVQEITRHWPVSEVGDGFFLSVLRKPQ